MSDTHYNYYVRWNLLCIQLELNDLVDFNYWKSSAEQVDFQFAAMYNSVTLGHIPWG